MPLPEKRGPWRARHCSRVSLGPRALVGTAWPGRLPAEQCCPCSQDRNSLGGAHVPKTAPAGPPGGPTYTAPLRSGELSWTGRSVPGQLQAEDGRLPRKSGPGDSTYSAAGPRGLRGAGPPVPSSCYLGAHLGLSPSSRCGCVCVRACMCTCVCLCSFREGGSPLVGDPSQSQTVALPCKSERPGLRRAND